MRLLPLGRGVHGNLRIAPRWPSRAVTVNSEVLEQLQAIQANLPAAIGLIVTRGFEARATKLGGARRLFRALGIRLFALCYPRRRDEIGDIFGANGHDTDGTHVDVSFCLAGKRVRMLPLGVFTPPAWQRRCVARHAGHLARIREAMEAAGFRLHRNATESLQMHLDYVPRGATSILP